MMLTADTFDYAPAIRDQLAREIEGLRLKLGEDHQLHLYGGDYSADNIVGQYATIGSLIRLHKGHPVVEEGEMLGGLPVRIDRDHPRTITVRADHVLFVRDSDDEEIDSCMGRKLKRGYYHKDLMESTTW